MEMDVINFISVAAANVWKYIKQDWHSNRIRFCAEAFAWACSVISAVIFAATVPDIQWYRFILSLFQGVVLVVGHVGLDAALD